MLPSYDLVRSMAIQKTSKIIRQDEPCAVQRLKTLFPNYASRRLIIQRLFYSEVSEVNKSKTLVSYYVLVKACKPENVISYNRVL